MPVDGTPPPLPRWAEQVQALAKESLTGAAMRAAVGDRLQVPGRVVGTAEQWLEIVEVRGRDGGPPYLVRRDGHEVLVYPGPETSVVHPDSDGPT
jgi:hypothetical protein